MSTVFRYFQFSPKNVFRQRYNNNINYVINVSGFENDGKGYILA